MITKKQFEKTLHVLYFAFLLSIVSTSLIVLAGISDFTQINNQTIGIIVFLIASTFAIVIYNLITTCITIIGWFRKKQHTQGYHTLVDKGILSCCAKQESFLYDEKFLFCPSCGMKINEVILN